MILVLMLGVGVYEFMFDCEIGLWVMIDIDMKILCGKYEFVINMLN